MSQKKTPRITKSLGPTFSTHFSLGSSRLQDRGERALRKIARKLQVSWGETGTSFWYTSGWSAYRLYGNFVEKFPSNGTGIFLAPKTGTGLSCTIDYFRIPHNTPFAPEILHNLLS